MQVWRQFKIVFIQSTGIRAVVYTIDDVTDRDIDEPDQSLTYSMTTDLPEVSV